MFIYHILCNKTMVDVIQPKLYANIWVKKCAFVIESDYL